MSTINSISSSGMSHVPSSSASTRTKPSTFELNSKEVGPAAASLIGIADAASDGASALYTFSTESLEKLGKEAESAYHAVGDTLSAIGDTMGHAFQTVEQGVEDAADEISTLTHQGVEALEQGAKALFDEASHWVDSVENTVSSATEAIGDAASSVADEISSAASSVGSYLALGVAAGAQLIDEIA